MKTIGIFLHGQQGDVMEAMSVLKYRDELWPDSKIVWYIAEENKDLLKHQDIEVRIFPRGFGYPEMVIEENKKLEGTDRPRWEDWLPLVDSNNHLNLSLKHNYPSISGIDYGYFPAPHQVPVTKRHNIEYSNVSKKVFGVPENYEWHPYLLFSDEEVKVANLFMDLVGRGRVIMFETFAGSGQSRLEKEMIYESMELCRSLWKDCKFIFASHKFLKAQEQFPENFFIDNEDCFSCAEFTVRQCALIANQCNLMISVSSGISVAASCWGNGVTMLQFCGSKICSTAAIANGHFELVTADDKPFERAKAEFNDKLINLLNEYA